MLRHSLLRFFILGFSLLLMTGCTSKIFHVETIIKAPPAEVWAVLMDTSSYPEWNPVFVQVDGTYQANGNVTNHVKFPDGSIVAIESSIETLQPERELRQTGGTFALLTYDHQWLLEEVDGGTRVIQHEVDSGIYLWFWDSSWIEPAYQQTNAALKKRVLDLRQQ